MKEKSLTELLAEADAHIKKAERLKKEREAREDDIKTAKIMLYNLIASFDEEVDV